jgi:hypothetical protein
LPASSVSPSSSPDPPRRDAAASDRYRRTAVRLLRAAAVTG